MARELDSEMLRRLQESYREMSDGELQGLAASPDELTDVALEILRGEMTHRGLKAEAADSFSGSEPEPRFGTRLAEGKVVLTTFTDAIAFGIACKCLEERGVDFDVRDVSQKSSGSGSFYGGPPVALELIVTVADRERAMTILREKTGLFPLQEVEEADELVDDGTTLALGNFGRRVDAEEVAKALDDARIWHRIVANPEGTAEDENAYSVEVREVDLVEAGDVVERAFG